MTSEAASSQVAYGLDDTYGSLSALDTTLGTEHSVTLIGLTAGGTYHYQVLSVDVAGNAGSSTDATFVMDTMAPTVMIEQATGQADPTNQTPINFTVVFKRAGHGLYRDGCDAERDGRGDDGDGN